MRTGLYFGTYNPIHKGHLVIANYMINNAGLDRIWMVVSPQNPLKTSDDLLTDYQRLELVKIALKTEDKRIIASDIEFKLPKPSYTLQSLNYIQEKFPDDTFVLIMGEDNLRQFEKWRDHAKIAKIVDIYVYPRLVNEAEAEQDRGNIYFNHKKIKIFDVPMINISSSEIRSKISTGEAISEFVHSEVAEKIKAENYFIENHSQHINLKNES